MEVKIVFLFGVFSFMLLLKFNNTMHNTMITLPSKYSHIDSYNCASLLEWPIFFTNGFSAAHYFFFCHTKFYCVIVTLWSYSTGWQLYVWLSYILIFGFVTFYLDIWLLIRPKLWRKFLFYIFHYAWISCDYNYWQYKSHLS